MKLRLAALCALPAVVSLAACGGGSTGVANTTSAQAYVRVLNGLPSNGPVDIYIQSTGTASPSSPIVASERYAVASDYITEPAAAASVIVQNAGGAAPSTGSPQLASCPLPQLANNAKYSVVLATSAGVVNCRIFQDLDYTAALQYRFHHASANTSALDYGVITQSNAPIGTPFTVQGTATQGALAVGGTTPSFTQVKSVTAVQSSASVTFAAGTGPGSGTDVSQYTLDSSRVFAPNGTSQANPSGNLGAYVTGIAGTSLFTLDCTPAAVAGFTGVTCNGGTALLGYTDSK